MAEPSYLDKIKKNIYDVNNELMQIGSLHGITKKYLEELQVKYNCCCDLTTKFNKHIKEYNAGIATYNDFLSRLKLGQWIKDTNFLKKTNELLQLTKLLVKNAFRLDKIAFDQLFSLDNTQRTEGSNSIVFKNLLALLQLPPVPTTCPVLGKKGGKTKKKIKKTKKKIKKTKKKIKKIKKKIKKTKNQKNIKKSNKI